MVWDWVARRRLTLGFVVFFVVWYLAQLYVLSAFGSPTAVWWFYFSSDPSMGYLLAPISHDMTRIGHLGSNVMFLLVFGGFAEPHLDRRRYVVLLLGISFGSIGVANVLSGLLGTRWILAGPSGGVLGLWAYTSAIHRGTLWDSLRSGDSSQPTETVVVFFGLLSPVLVPCWEVYSTGTANTSHAVGVLFGYVLVLVEVPPQVSIRI
jgi:membrane associated rhomboid family serine protease